MLRRRLLLLLVLLWASSAQAVFPVVEATSTSVTSAASLTHVVTLPASVSAGELLLCGLSIDNGADNVTSVTWPAGWTELAEEPPLPDTTFKHIHALAYRIAAGGETTVTVTLVGNTEHSAHACYRISGYVGIPLISSMLFFAAGVDVDTALLDPPGAAQDTLWITWGIGQEGSNLSVTGCPTNYTTLLLSQQGATTTGGSVFSCRRALNATSEDPGVFAMTSNLGSRGWTIAVLSQIPAAGSMATKGLMRTLR